MANHGNFSWPHPASGHASFEGATTIDNRSDNNISMLPSDFEPEETDVICQRGKDSFDHVGNKLFRELIEKHISSYLEAGSRHEKSTIVSKIYDHIRHNARKPSTGFVRKDLLTRRWFVVNEKEARDKVGQALRDAIKIIRSTSSKSKSEKASLDSSNPCMITSDATVHTADSSRKGPTDTKGNPRKTKRARPADSDEDLYGDSMEQLKVPHWKASQKLESEARPDRDTRTTFAFDNDPGQSSSDRFDDLDGLAISTMLESSIEPLHTTNLNNRKFSNPDSCAFPNSSVSECLEQSCGLLQDSMASTNLTSHLCSTSRRIPLNADVAISAPGIEQRNEWQMRMNAAFGSASFLPVMGAPGPSVFSHPAQSQTNSSHQDQKRQMAVGPWDLEPTPLINQSQTENSNDQRAAALARLLFHDESSL